MGRIPALSGRQLIRLLERAGFRVLQQRGSHVKLRKADVVVVVPVHGNKSLKRPTMMGILKDAGLSPDEVARLL